MSNGMFSGVVDNYLKYIFKGDAPLEKSDLSKNAQQLLQKTIRGEVDRGNLSVDSSMVRNYTNLPTNNSFFKQAMNPNAYDEINLLLGKFDIEPVANPHADIADVVDTFDFRAQPDLRYLDEAAERLYNSGFGGTQIYDKYAPPSWPRPDGMLKDPGLISGDILNKWDYILDGKPAEEYKMRFNY